MYGFHITFSRTIIYFYLGIYGNYSIKNLKRASQIKKSIKKTKWLVLILIFVSLVLSLFWGIYGRIGQCFDYSGQMN